MYRLLPISLILCVFLGCSAGNDKAEKGDTSGCAQCEGARCADCSHHVSVGAERTEMWLPMFENKRVALYSNQTGVVGDRHVADVMKESGVDLRLVFSPEHGFRGTADAGELVSSGVDAETGLQVVSLYGKGRAQAMADAMRDVDVVVVDIQDVGLRFYTYYCTMLELIEEASKQQKDVVIFDRPNPNGMTVDGPILDMKYESGVGRLPIPVLHGLTLGEMAQMAVGEGWTPAPKSLQVVPCKGYTHQTRYRLPVAPSPNLPNMTSIYLYPSTCYFEATDVSLGRGTDKPFQIYGHPDFAPTEFEFTPRSTPGAKNPPQLDQHCYGVDLSGISDDDAIAMGVNLEYLIDAYRRLDGKMQLTSFFEKLIGNGNIRGMIESGMSADQIRATWQDELDQYRNLRRKYLIYNE